MTRACLGYGGWFLASAGLLALTYPGRQIRGEEPAASAAVAPEVLSAEQRREASGMIERDIRRRTDAVNLRNRAEWSRITTRAEWEAFRDERIERLRKSLGDFPAPVKPDVRVTGVVDGDGFRIENVVYQSRPGQWVTANLYVPAEKTKSMPGILLAHAHHRDKPETELQDMGMTWARAGCQVLVIDQVGYGERRSHPFHRASDYPKQFAVSRQDYQFRYDTGVQLQLAGDSLMGWMAWDLMRGVDLLLAREGTDPKRIIILGSVAGGGDPAGVTAALDRRIACCVPFNFGGPQPETRYPLPEDAETSFNYLAGSYWESTRGLRLGGRDDFLHWVIVGSTAPRALIHAHEFEWDGERDPVWKRYQKIWGEFYGSADRLGVAHGKGLLRQSSSEASHCNNIGRFHRRMIHPLFEKWFGIKVTEQDEFHAPRTRDELISLTEKTRQELRPKSLNELMSDLGTERIETSRKRVAGKSPAERRRILQEDWGRLLGPVAPAGPAKVTMRSTDEKPIGGATVERVVLEVEPGIVVPVLVLNPVTRAGRAPLVVGVAQAGKAGFLKARAGEIDKLVRSGVVVMLPDLRGTGESRSGSSRGKESGDTGLSVNVQLFGETLLGERLRDLRSVLVWARSRPDVDRGRIALWGDSFVAPNAPDTNDALPRGIDGWPHQPEPLGALLGLLGGLFEDDVHAVFASGGITNYHGALTHFAVLLPHDACVPGAIAAGDLGLLAGGLAPRPLRLEATVDSRNRLAPAADVSRSYADAAQAYSTTPSALQVAAQRSSAADWLIDALK